MGKLIVMVIMAVLGYQNQVAVAKYLEYLKNASPLIQTYMEMDSFKTKMAEYVQVNEGRLPENIGEWINQNFKSAQKSDMSLDFFGTPYQMAQDQNASRVYLKSCGPDKECSTDDDIEMIM